MSTVASLSPVALNVLQITSQLREAKHDGNRTGFVALLMQQGISEELCAKFWEAFLLQYAPKPITKRLKNADVATHVGLEMDPTIVPRALLLYLLMEQQVPELCVKITPSQTAGHGMGVLLEFSNSMPWSIPFYQFFTGEAPEEITVPPKPLRKRKTGSRRSHNQATGPGLDAWLRY